MKTEVAEKINKSLKGVLKEEFAKEKLEILRNHKTEVKYWKNELGGEKKTNVKLNEKLEDKKGCEY